MKYATFVNYSKEDITLHWNGKPYTIKAGGKRAHIQEGIARVFAKHLANRELIRNHKDNYTSPKKPLEVPEFMNEFNKAFILENDGRESDPETGLVPDNANQVSSDINIVPRRVVDPYDATQNQVLGPGDKAQVIGVATEGDEGSFEDSNQTTTDNTPNE